MSQPGSSPSRIRAVFAGRVQGVSFRATSLEISRRFEVVGFVRNRPDGTVELEAEGTVPVIDEFIAEIQRVFSRHVVRVDRTELPPALRETRFEITF